MLLHDTCCHGKQPRPERLLLPCITPALELALQECMDMLVLWSTHNHCTVNMLTRLLAPAWQSRTPHVHLKHASPSSAYTSSHAHSRISSPSLLSLLCFVERSRAPSQRACRSLSKKQAVHSNLPCYLPKSLIASLGVGRKVDKAFIHILSA